MKLSFGIKTAPQYTTYEAMLRVWQEADTVQIFESAWLFDHFMPISGDISGPCLEGWTLLSAFAALTKCLRVGVMVTGNTYRHPAVLANMGATVDIISNGRMDFGIGAGWNVTEHSSYGIPLYGAGERLRRLAEACEVIKRLWTETAPDFEGQYYQLKQAYCEPKPVQKPYPPFAIGGSGERVTLRIAAQYADIWNYAGGTADDFRHKCEVLDSHCVALGRDPNTIERSVQLYSNLNDVAALRDTVRSFIQAGATHLLLGIRYPYPDGVVHRLAEEIAEPLTREFA